MMAVVKRCAWKIGNRMRTREARYQVSDTEQVAEELAIVVREQRSGPAELAERSEDTARIVELMERLKPDERAALILFGLGCSYAEICELRGWSTTDHSAISLVLDGRQGFFLDPADTEAFVGGGEGDTTWLEFRTAFAASVLVEPNVAQDGPGEAMR